MFIGGNNSFGGSSSSFEDGFESHASYQSHNDEQSALIESSLKKTNNFVQMNRAGNFSRKFMLLATLVTDPNKRIVVEISETDTVRNLQVIIGEGMKTNHAEMFQSLDAVRAFNITMVKDKLFNLKDEFLASEYLQDNDEVLFEIDSTNLWLKVNFQLYD